MRMDEEERTEESECFHNHLVFRSYRNIPFRRAPVPLGVGSRLPLVNLASSKKLHCLNVTRRLADAIKDHIGDQRGCPGSVRVPDQFPLLLRGISPGSLSVLKT